MQAELIFTGSELLQGRVVNSHAQYLGRWLSEHSFDVALHVTVGDYAERLEQVVRQALKRSDLILITGGLGPTTDDLTKETVAQVLGLPMLLDHNSLEAMKDLFERRGMSMPESNIRQAYIPQGATVLPNKLGTAPGVLIEKDNKIVALLPGPPYELTAMFEKSLAPFLSRKTGSETVIKSKILKVTGIAESAVQDLLKDLGGQGNPSITYLASPGQLQVRISGQAASGELAENIVAELAEKITNRLGEYVFAYDDEIIEHVVGKQLLNRGLAISAAESCTGGLIASRLIDMPGSSAYFTGGVVAYSNEVKISLLGVPAEIIDSHGAVSEETAVAMARGVRSLVGSDLSLAVTGIAGPDGATPGKPVGLVYVAMISEDGVSCRKFHFPGNRLAVRMGTANAALNMVRLFLEKK